MENEIIEEVLMQVIGEPKYTYFYQSAFPQKNDKLSLLKSG